MTAPEIESLVQKLLTSTSEVIESSGLVREMIRHAWISEITDLVVAAPFVLLGFYFFKKFKQEEDLAVADRLNMDSDHLKVVFFCFAVIIWFFTLFSVACSIQNLFQLSLAPKACVFRYVLKYLRHQ